MVSASTTSSVSAVLHALEHPLAMHLHHLLSLLCVEHRGDLILHLEAGHHRGASLLRSPFAGLLAHRLPALMMLGQDLPDARLLIGGQPEALGHHREAMLESLPVTGMSTSCGVGGGLWLLRGGEARDGADGEKERSGGDEASKGLERVHGTSVGCAGSRPASVVTLSRGSYASLKPK